MRSKSETLPSPPCPSAHSAARHKKEPQTVYALGLLRCLPQLRVLAGRQGCRGIGIDLDGGQVITVTPHMILRPYRTAVGGAGGHDTPTKVAVMLELAG